MYRDVLEKGPDEFSYRFWEVAELVEELLKPISDGIHNLEADEAMLSQVQNNLVHKVYFAVTRTVPHLLNTLVVKLGQPWCARSVH
jgi:hypothetical protein